MNSHSDLRTEVRKALLKKFAGTTDAKGYTRSPQENLLDGIKLETVEDDFRQGDGDELRMMFCAVHSSAALAVNCFGPFKVHPERLALLGNRGAEEVCFEKKLPIFDRGTAPNIDVWIDRGRDVGAVESKLLEYLTPKAAAFSEAYEKLAPESDEARWWELYKRVKDDPKKRFLDRAQLIKHYFGLNKFLKGRPDVQNGTLLYAFWEPLNWQGIDECIEHREELQEFQRALSDSQVRFEWKSYNDLWEEWSGIDDLETYAHQLKARYQVALSRR